MRYSVKLVPGFQLRMLQLLIAPRLLLRTLELAPEYPAIGKDVNVIVFSTVPEAIHPVVQASAPDGVLRGLALDRGFERRALSNLEAERPVRARHHPALHGPPLRPEYGHQEQCEPGVAFHFVSVKSGFAILSHFLRKRGMVFFRSVNSAGADATP